MQRTILPSESEQRSKIFFYFGFHEFRLLKSVTKSNDSDWWKFDHIVAGRDRIKLRIVPEHGIIDLIFVGGGVERNLYLRIIPNQNDFTTTWTSLRPDAFTDEESRSQLDGIETELRNWKSLLEGRKE